MKKYPLFYLYIGCVFLKELLGVSAFLFAPATYAIVYWPTELLTVVASFAVLVELFRGTVRHNPGVVRFVQNSLLLAFSVTALYVSVTFSYRGLSSIFRGIEQLGRDLRLLEGGLLIALLWVLVRYRIAPGRNLLGLTVGYSLWIGINLTDFAFLPAPGDETSAFLRLVVPASYTVTLAVWCATLWAPEPEPAQPANQLETDYDFFAAKTRALITRTSDSMLRVIKP